MRAVADIPALIRRDARLGRAFRLAGPPADRRRPRGFATLLRTIVDQQISTAAGASIWRRLEEALGAVTPDAVLAAGEAGLRAAGLSGPKVRAAEALAKAVAGGALDIDALARLDDAAARAALMAVKGIGRWTADIYLMFSLDRRDVWPAHDLALAVATARLLALPQRPTPREMDALAEPWRPWRSSAALILWRFYRYRPEAAA